MRNDVLIDDVIKKVSMAILDLEVACTIKNIYNPEIDDFKKF